MEKSFVISSDSTCDLYRDYVRAHDIRIVPLHYTMEEGGVLHEGVDDFAEYGQYIDFYRRLRAGGFSRTSMLTYDAHCAHFEQLIEGGAREIVHVSLSGGLSPTANVAAQAARDVSAKHPGCRIYPVDSLAATIAQGALVREAVALHTGLPCVGYLQKNPALALKSRHLGLVPAQEVPDVAARVEEAARAAQQTLDLPLLSMTETDGSTVAGSYSFRGLSLDYSFTTDGSGYVNYPSGLVSRSDVDYFFLSFASDSGLAGLDTVVYTWQDGRIDFTYPSSYTADEISAVVTDFLIYLDNYLSGIFTPLAPEFAEPVTTIEAQQSEPEAESTQAPEQEAEAPSDSSGPVPPAPFMVRPWVTVQDQEPAEITLSR